MHNVKGSVSGSYLMLLMMMLCLVRNSQLYPPVLLGCLEI